MGQELTDRMLARAVRLILLFVALSACVGASAQSLSDPLATMNGRWVWIGNRDKLGLENACAEHWTEFKVSADHRVLSFRYQIVKEGTREENAGTYNVLYQDGNSVAMYLNGEERHLKNGDHYIWIAVVEDRDRFLWRIHGIAGDPAELARLARVRCPAR